MAKGSSIPSGVGSYTHTTGKTTGKYHPSMGGGLENVKVNSGSSPAKVDTSTGAKSRIPSGVKRGDGTETRKGTKVEHKFKPTPVRTPSTKDAWPSGVKRSDGTKAPKSAK